MAIVTQGASRRMREAEVLASLNHPNIAAIYDFQEAARSRFLVLQLIEATEGGVSPRWRRDGKEMF